MVARDVATVSVQTPPQVIDVPIGTDAAVLSTPNRGDSGPVYAPPSSPILTAPGAPQTVGSSFIGINLNDQFTAFGSGSIPPDTMGAVGPDHFVEAINSSVAVYDKATGTRLSHVSLNSFFTVTVGPTTYPRNGSFDPRICFDRRSGRYLACVLERGAVSGTQNGVILAVSRTGDATGVWDKYFLDVGDPASGGTTFFTDYDTLGTDDNGVYLGVRIFPSTGGSTAKIIATPKAPLLAGAPSLGTVTQFSGITDMFSTPQPALNFDATASGGPAFFVASSAFVLADVFYRSLTWSGGVPTLSALSTLATPAFAAPINAPASGSGTPINVGDMRLQMAIVRNGALWTARTIGCNSAGTDAGADRDGCEWFQLRITGASLSIDTHGRVFDTAAATPRSYFYPSIVVSGQGHAAMGFSGVASTEFVGAYATGRLRTDTAGTMYPPALLKSGDATYTRLDSSGRNRWGDYSYTSLDPRDDMTIWTIQEYATSIPTLIWGTWINSLVAPPPATPTSVSATVAQGATAVNVTLTGTSVGGSEFYDPGSVTIPGVGSVNRIAASVGGAGVTVNSVTYTDPTHVTLNVTVSAGAAPGARTVTVTNPDGQTASSAAGILTVTAPAPTVVSLNRAGANPSNAATVNWTLTFSSAVTGVVASNFSLAGGAVPGASVGVPSTGDGGVNWNVPVTTGASNGTLTLSLANSTGQSPTTATTLPFVGQTYDMDKTVPTVTVTPASGTFTTSPITFTLTFSEAVSGLTAAGVTVTNGTKGALAGGPTVYTIPVTPTTVGAVTCAVPAGSATDGVNSNSLSNTASVTFSPPTVTSLNRVNANPSNLSTVNWTLVLTTAATPLSASNFSLTGTATAGASVGTPTTGNGGLTWNVPVTTGAGSGTLTLNLATTTGATPPIFGTLPFVGQSYDMDKTVPTVAVTPASGTFSTSPITFTLTFSEAVSGLTVAGVTVTNGTKGALAGGPTIYTIPVTPTASGTVTCLVPAGSASDSAGNGNAVSNTASVTYAPSTVTSLNRVNANPSNLSTVNWTLVLTVAATPLSASNFSLTGTATAGASVGTPTTGNGGLTWNVPVTTGAGTGTLTLNLANSTGVTPPISGTLPFVGETYDMDKTAPTVAVTPASGTVATSPITFTLTFSEPVSGLTAAAITVTNGTKGALAGGPTVYTIPVTPSAAGTVTCLVPAGSAADPAGNPNSASNLASVTYGPAPTVTCTTTVTAMQPSGGGLTNVGLTVTSSDPAATRTIAVYSNDNNLTGTSTSFFFNGGFYYPKPAAAQLVGSTLLLRADRYATPGRVYLIVAKATSPGGATGFACCTVVVPYAPFFLAPPATITAPAAAAKAYCDANAGAPPPGALPPAGAGYDTHLAPTALP